MCFTKHGPTNGYFTPMVLCSNVSAHSNVKAPTPRPAPSSSELEPKSDDDDTPRLFQVRMTVR